MQDRLNYLLNSNEKQYFMGELFIERIVHGRIVRGRIVPERIARARHTATFRWHLLPYDSLL